MPKPTDCYTVFDGTRRLGGGSLAEASRLALRALDGDPEGPVLVFDDRSGAVVDLDPRQPVADASPADGGDADPAQPDAQGPRGRGRPKLGVIAREVTLLPRHWDWLAQQSGGASVALRRLVEAALRAAAAEPGPDAQRRSRERAYRFMTTMAGDLPNYEEATRALFAGDAERLRALTASWPRDIREHGLRLAGLAR